MARQHGTTRLFTDADLIAGETLELEASQARYLASVLRSAVGAEVRVFNGRDGEWLATVEDLSPRRGRVVLVSQVRGQEIQSQPGPALISGIWLGFALVKRAASENIIQKATEMGVGQFYPATTERSAPGVFKSDRLRSIAVGAAEQCGRLDVPAIADPQTLLGLLDAWPRDRLLLMADETGGGRPIASIVEDVQTFDGRLGLLIGPEGGFSESELDAADRTSNLLKIDLGPRILRADTAAIAGLAALQSVYGDWRR
jgi:16S rRNA (uracil1498-N3)-methyltransferase